MPIVATVTRSSVSRFFSQAAQNVGNSGGNNYTLRKADGSSLGGYGSLSQAQAAFNQFHGPNRVYKWERRDLAGAIEQHVCIGTPLDPAEIWVLQQGSPQIPNATPVATALTQWIEVSAAPGSAKLSQVGDTSLSGTIATVSDLSGASNQLVTDDANSPPTLIESDDDYNGRQSIDISGAGEGFQVPNLGNLEPPYTLIIVANDLDLTDGAILIEVDNVAEMRIGDFGTFWTLRVDGNNITSTVPCDSSPAILTAIISPTTSTFRVNGDTIGSVAATSGPGPLIVGGLASDPWTGRFAAYVLTNQVDSNLTRVLQTERYLRERYQ